MKHFLSAILFLLTSFIVTAHPEGKPTFEPYPSDTAYACNSGEYKGLSIKNEGAESFQWQEYDYSTKSWKNLVDGQKFSGTNKFNISILVDNPPFEHMLRCILSNSFGDTPGDSIVFKAVVPPTLTAFPAFQSVCLDETISMFPVLSTPGATRYIWQKKEGNNWVATGNLVNFEIEKVKLSDDGIYRCMAQTTFCGTLYSNEIRLQVNDCHHPVVDTSPQGGTYCAGSNAVLTSTGRYADNYQWEMLKGGLWLPVTDGPIFKGSQTNRLEIINTQAAQATEYFCRLTNPYGIATTKTARISVKQFSFSISPQKTTDCPGSNVSFDVFGSDATSFTWQKRNGNSWQNIGGNTNSLLVAGIGAADTGSYRCIASTGCGPDTTNIALLELKENCQIPNAPGANALTPNAFSPNGDGINDRWLLGFLENRPNSSVRVFSRDGAVVFESKGYPKPWDGTHKGKPLPVGVYYYMITTNDLGDLTGSVSLVR